MPQNPEFVRLSDHMVSGLIVDMETGWSISGYDVQPFPADDREKARFVRQKINAGALEPASQAEYDEAHPEGEGEDGDAEVERLGQALGVAMRGAGKQEHVIREREMARHGSLQTARAKAKLQEQGIDVEDDASLSEAEYAAEEARLQALADEQEEADLATDDPEEQEERTATRPAKKAVAKKAAGTRKRS